MNNGARRTLPKVIKPLDFELSYNEADIRQEASKEYLGDRWKNRNNLNWLDVGIHEPLRGCCSLSFVFSLLLGLELKIWWLVHSYHSQKLRSREWCSWLGLKLGCNGSCHNELEQYGRKPYCKGYEQNGFNLIIISSPLRSKTGRMVGWLQHNLFIHGCRKEE